MKRAHAISTAITAGALALAIGPGASASELLLNGSFEGPPADNGPGYERGAPPSGWSTLSGYENPDIISNGYAQGSDPFKVLLGAEDGSRFLDMNGVSPTGGIFQDVGGLLAGGQATLTYWYSQWAQNSAGELVASLIDPTTLDVLNSTTTTITFNNTVQSSQWYMLTLQTLVPASGQLRVQFFGNSHATDRGGPGLDNVTLTAPSAAPEPAAWALMISGFGLAGTALRRRRGTPATA